MSLEIMWAPLDSMSGSMSEIKLDPKLDIASALESKNVNHIVASVSCLRLSSQG